MLLRGRRSTSSALSNCSSARDAISAKYNYVLSLLRLEAAIGELTEADLVAVNR